MQGKLNIDDPAIYQYKYKGGVKSMITPVMRERKRRLLMALALLRSNQGIEVYQAISKISFELGLSLEKAKEYIKTLEGLGYIEIKEGKVYAKEKGEI